LATLLIRVNQEDLTARKIKADAFNHLAITVTNPNWRNWYITEFWEDRRHPEPRRRRRISNCGLVVF
jgi:alkyl sulfatase BDS1-like metallo-beta-lactamase superfamily hydrolase